MIGATVPFGATATLTPTTDAATARRAAVHLTDRLAGLVTSVVPGAESVVVHAAAGVPVTRLAAQVETTLATLPDHDTTTPRLVEIPVSYNGEDLTTVADLLGVSVSEVIARHTGATYEVEFLGFAPGFPYLTGLDPFLAAVPRLNTPRTRVAAGSIGMAAGRTCIYPTASPGGWRLLGATSMSLFDATNADSPALFAPGDRVRFTVERDA